MFPSELPFHPSASEIYAKVRKRCEEHRRNSPLYQLTMEDCKDIEQQVRAEIERKHRDFIKEVQGVADFFGDFAKANRTNLPNSS